MENIQKKEIDPALKKEKAKRLIINLLPIAALILLFVTYLIILVAKNYSIKINLGTLMDETIILVLVATGAIFIFTLGSFDISLGASTLFSATIGILVYNKTGSVFMLFLTCIIVAVLCSLLNAGIASIFHIPLFVTTVAMLSVLSAIASNIITQNGTASGTSVVIKVATDLKAPLENLDNIWFKLIVLVVFGLLCFFIFNYTKIGRRQKFLGGNPVCAKMTGISMGLYGIIAFIMAGIAVGLGSSMTVIYSRTISNSTASSIGMSVFIAIVFGGMPISGGPRSRIYAAIVGGFSYIIVKDILFILFESIGGSRDGYVQIISAVLFLTIVFITSMNYRSKALPR